MVQGIHKRIQNKEHCMVMKIISLEEENLSFLSLSQEWFDQLWFFRLQEQMDQYKRAIDQLEVII